MGDKVIGSSGMSSRIDFSPDYSVRRREAVETEARRGFSQVRPTEAHWQSIEKAEREKPCRARGSGDAAGNNPG